MSHWRSLLISIFILAILTSSSLAAIKTVTYSSSLYANLTPPGELVDWNDNFTFPYFDPAMGKLISVYFAATLNATLDGAAENGAPKPVQNAYFAVDAYMDAVMINGQHIPLQVYLRVPETGGINVTAYDGVWDFLGTSSFNGSDANDTWGYVYYDDSANTTDYVGTGTFPLLAYTRASSRVIGGGSWYSLITTLAWSNASIIYTYDDARCLSGFKKDGCTGLPLSGWNITVSNATRLWNATTDASGFWRICGLENNDTYTVCELSQDGWTQTHPDGCYSRHLIGESISNLNFTNKKLYCISGYKKDNCGDSPLSSWNITISNSTGYSANDTTGIDGKYEFCNLAPGNYTLNEELKQGWMQVIAPPEIVLNCSNITNQNFTNQKLLCISGYKLDDCTNAGIENWLITLNNNTTSNLTGSDGKYEFCNLVPGRYTLTEETKDGYISSGPISLDVNLPCGSNLTDQNFTNQALLCISGYKLDDCTNSGIENWLITLNNSSYTTSNLTGSDGKYEFCNLMPGSYTLTEETKDGYISSGPISLDVNLPCGSNLTDQNFTNQALLCISGYKLDDCTNAGIENWLITLNNSSYTTSNLTGSDGKYEFCNLMPGSYTLTEETKDGYISSGPISLDVTVPCGSNLTDQNFTNQALLCISGHKKNTCGEYNLSNWTIILSNSQGGAISALTNETGYYQFCGLPPGVYNLSEESKDGWSAVSAPGQVSLNCSDISGMDFVNSECCGSSLKINKTADFGPSPSSPVQVNQAINYTIVVENTGNETLYLVNVTDDKLGLIEQIPSLMPGEFRTFYARYIVTESDLCQNIINEALANATDPCNKTLQVNAAWSVPTNYTAAIKIDKWADVSSAGIGDVINYTYTVTNTGDVNLSDLKIEDDRLGPIGK